MFLQKKKTSYYPRYSYNSLKSESFTLVYVVLHFWMRGLKKTCFFFVIFGRNKVSPFFQNLIFDENFQKVSVLFSMKNKAHAMDASGSSAKKSVGKSTLKWTNSFETKYIAHPPTGSSQATFFICPLVPTIYIYSRMQNTVFRITKPFSAPILSGS